MPHLLRGIRQANKLTPPPPRGEGQGVGCCSKDQCQTLYLLHAAPPLPLPNSWGGVNAVTCPTCFEEFAKRTNSPLRRPAGRGWGRGGAARANVRLYLLQTAPPLPLPNSWGGVNAVTCPTPSRNPPCEQTHPSTASRGGAGGGVLRQGPSLSELLISRSPTPAPPQ